MAKEIRLPDIGDFKDVPIIEVQIAPGKSVRKEETILTLESDKATMDVPAPEDGVIGEVRVKVGDKISEGAVLATYAEGGEAKPPAAPPRPLRRRGDPGAHAQGRARDRSEARSRSGRQGGFRGRHSRPRRRPGRLHRGVPRRRSRAKRRAGRRPADARRRLPQRRLHPVEGAAARRQDRRRGGRDGRAWGQVRPALARSHGHSRLEGWGDQAADRRPQRSCQAAQSEGRDRPGEVHLAKHASG